MGSWAGPAAGIGSSLIGGASSIMGGYADAGMYKQQRAEYERAAVQKKTAADQEETIRRQDLQDSLGTIAALRASRGLVQDSPTGKAIRQTAMTRSEADIRTARLNALNEAGQLERTAAQYGQMAKRSVLGGWISGVGSILGGAGKAMG